MGVGGSRTGALSFCVPAVHMVLARMSDAPRGKAPSRTLEVIQRQTKKGCKYLLSCRMQGCSLYCSITRFHRVCRGKYDCCRYIQHLMFVCRFCVGACVGLQQYLSALFPLFGWQANDVNVLRRSGPILVQKHPPTPVVFTVGAGVLVPPTQPTFFLPSLLLSLSLALFLSLSLALTLVRHPSPSHAPTQSISSGISITSPCVLSPRVFLHTLRFPLAMSSLPSLGTPIG